MSRKLREQRDDIDEDLLLTLRSSCVGMALNRIEGEEELYVGGIWALKRPTALAERKITHVLSVVRCTPSETLGQTFRHMVIDVDDVEDEDLLYQLPRAVSFINQALHPEEKTALEFHEKAQKLRSIVAEDAEKDADAITPVPNLQNLSLTEPDTPETPGAVFVHCAMGKSRSVAVTAAYLLYKHPSKFGRASNEAVRVASKSSTSSSADRSKSTRAAVEAAVKHIRRTREIAEPNYGFMRQLEMWWDMGCPVGEGELESHPIYQKWSYKREVEESLAVGEAPARLRFEDEERAKVVSASVDAEGQQRGKELRCKKCRRVIATSTFVLDHQPPEHNNKQQRGGADTSCQHFFIEPLSWMRNTLETGELEGRLACPNERCGASLGRFSWKGFRCSCGGWVTPAFSLAKGRVDEALAPLGGPGRRPGAGTDAERAALGIRLPPTVGGPGRL